MTEKKERKYKVIKNNKECLVIEDKDNWIKIIPLDFPSSGTMFFYTDNRDHHWDFYDENGKKQEELAVYLEGYTLERLYVCAGQNAYKIRPGTDIESIPYKGVQEINASISLDKFTVSANADGCLLCAIKRPK